MNSISSVQQQHTNQHSLPAWTSPHHLKLRPHGRQIAQYISWSQGYSTSLLISEFILQTSILVWTVPDIYKYLLLWDILYIIRNCLMSTFQHKFNCANWSTSCGNTSWMKFVILRMHFLIFLKLPLFLCMRLVFFCSSIYYIVLDCSL